MSLYKKEVEDLCKNEIKTSNKYLNMLDEKIRYMENLAELVLKTRDEIFSYEIKMHVFPILLLIGSLLIALFSVKWGLILTILTIIIILVFHSRRHQNGS